MLPTEILYFTVTLFLALAALVQWKRRRDLIAARLNRGLSGYVATRRMPRRRPVSEKSPDERLITA
jgi:hypothetical protein